jgi:hypothetical protein
MFTVEPPMRDLAATTRCHACDQTGAARAIQRATVLGPCCVAMIAEFRVYDARRQVRVVHARGVRGVSALRSDHAWWGRCRQRRGARDVFTRVRGTLRKGPLILREGVSARGSNSLQTRTFRCPSRRVGAGRSYSSERWCLPSAPPRPNSLRYGGLGSREGPFGAVTWITFGPLCRDGYREDGFRSVGGADR